MAPGKVNRSNDDDVNDNIAPAQSCECECRSQASRAIHSQSKAERSIYRTVSHARYASTSVTQKTFPGCAKGRNSESPHLQKTPLCAFDPRIGKPAMETQDLLVDMVHPLPLTTYAPSPSARVLLRTPIFATTSPHLQVRNSTTATAPDTQAYDRCTIFPSIPDVWYIRVLPTITTQYTGYSIWYPQLSCPLLSFPLLFSNGLTNKAKKPHVLFPHPVSLSKRKRHAECNPKKEEP